MDNIVLFIVKVDLNWDENQRQLGLIFVPNMVGGGRAGRPQLPRMILLQWA